LKIIAFDQPTTTSIWRPQWRWHLQILPRSLASEN